MGRSLRYEDLYALRFASDPQPSPAGDAVAFVLSAADRVADADCSSIWSVPLGGGDPVQLTQGGRDVSPRWDPAGGSLAFLRPVDGQPQVWLLPPAGEPRSLTELPFGCLALAWSPDGGRLAVVSPVDGPRPGAPGRASAGRGDPVGPRGHEPVAVRTAAAKADGAGLLGLRRARLYLVDPTSGQAEPLGRLEGSVASFAWSLDGRHVAVVETPPEPDRDPRTRLVLIDVDGGRQRRLAPEWEGTYSAVVWTALGLVCVAQPHPGVAHSRLYALDPEGGVVRALAPDFDRNVMVGAPAYPGALPAEVSGSLVFCARDGGCTHAYLLEEERPRKIVGGEDRVVTGLGAAAGRIACVLATPTDPSEVYALDAAGKGEQRLTNLNDALVADLDLHPRRARTFVAPDGTKIQGWVVEGDGPRPAPLLVDIHGGPHNAWSPVFDAAHLYHEVLAARGWSVLLLNSRGSDGYGEDFYRALVGAWGIADEGDFLAAVDTLVAEGLADPERLCVCGYSYGGYLTNWLTSRTDRFRAAVSGGCVSDLASFYGTSDVGWLLGQFEVGAEPHEAPERYAELSPFRRVAEVRTPTLILHGEDDLRCPVGQAEQWFVALRRRCVECEMVRYPGASHLFILNGRPSHRIDYNRRVEEWVVRYVTKPPRPPRNLPAADLLAARLEELAGRHRVPGASLGIFAGGDVVRVATGVTSLATGVEVTPDTVFQIGSMTKPYTATVILQLVEEGKLSLDEPVRTYLKGFRVADPDVTAKVTLRHLLSHTSGIDGDYFEDFGRGDDCLERYVASLGGIGQTHPLGETMSYCNTGYSIAGRIIEVVEGKVWDEVMRERIFQPLGMTHTSTLPEEAILHRVAVGHTKTGPAASWEPTRTWILPRIAGPMGLINSTVGDVLRFARLHLESGEFEGRRLLSETSVRAMQEPQVAVPDPYMGSHLGLGWILFDWGGQPGSVYGHDGNTIGQSSFLRIVPHRELAIVLLTNGGSAPGLYRELYGELLAELAGIELPPRPAPPSTPLAIDLERYAGTYERLGLRTDLRVEGSRLVGTATVTGALARLLPDPTQRITLVPVDAQTFLSYGEGEEEGVPVVFYDFEDGIPRYLHSGGRANRRTR